MYGRNRFLRMMGYTIELLILYVLQETPGIFGAINGVKPELVISVVVTIAVFEDQKVGLIFGIIAGVLMDIGYGTMIGFNMIIMSVLCYIIGVLATDYMKINMITSFICTVAAVGINLTAHYVFLYMMMGYGSNVYAYAHHYLPIMLYSIIPLPIVYLINRGLVKWCADSY